MVSKGAERFVLWPCYFDAALPRKAGRRVAEAYAVKAPDAKWIEATARKLGLVAELEEGARHPSIPYERSGRVLVARGGPKQAILNQVGAKMREGADAGR